MVSSMAAPPTQVSLDIYWNYVFTPFLITILGYGLYLMFNVGVIGVSMCGFDVDSEIVKLRRQKTAAIGHRK